MAKVTFILGLCGSGKTYLAEQLKNETGAEVFENLLSDGSRLPALVECLRDGKDCVVDDARCCLPAYRNEIVQHLSRIICLKMRRICYEDDLECACWNVIHRKNKGDLHGHLDM